jgi:catechol 2,3-dioxygenase-like lactoylglutathione lyase family enzyme
MTATTKPVGIRGFSHVAIPVGDLDTARRFYCETLGFEELPRPDFGIDGVWLRVGDLQLHLIVVGDAGPPAGAAHFALHVPTEAFPETIDALREAGAELRGEPMSRVDFGTTVWAAFMTDPFGNAIELTDVGPLQPA